MNSAFHYVKQKFFHFQWGRISLGGDWNEMNIKVSFEGNVTSKFTETSNIVLGTAELLW